MGTAVEIGKAGFGRYVAVVVGGTTSIDDKEEGAQVVSRLILPDHGDSGSTEKDGASTGLREGVVVGRRSTAVEGESISIGEMVGEKFADPLTSTEGAVVAHKTFGCSYDGN